MANGDLHTSLCGGATCGSPTAAGCRTAAAAICFLPITPQHVWSAIVCVYQAKGGGSHLVCVYWRNLARYVIMQNSICCVFEINTLAFSLYLLTIFNISVSQLQNLFDCTISYKKTCAGLWECKQWETFNSKQKQAPNYNITKQRQKWN